MSDINCYGTEEFYGEALPHWYLVRLVDVKKGRPYTVNGFEMKEGSWGLTYINDPDFVFDIGPMPDYTLGVPDDCPDEDYPKEPEGYREMLHHYNQRLTGPVICGYRLVKAAIQSGWAEEGGGFTCFISHKMWECLERCDWKPIEVYYSI